MLTLPRKKDQRTNVRWTDKNKLYLQRLGLIDQHGRSRANKKELPDEAITSVNEFVNECVALVCEAGMHSRNSVASGDELRMAWNAHNILKLGDKINELVNAREALREQMPADWTVVNGRVKVYER